MVIVSNKTFDWTGARRQCINNGYNMSIIQSTAEHTDLVNTMSDPLIDGIITTCWLGAYGFFISSDNVTITWVWDKDSSIVWDETLAAQYLVAPSSRVDVTTIQGLILRNDNSEWLWTYANADFLYNAVGRRCVVCLNDKPCLVFILEFL